MNFAESASARSGEFGHAILRREAAKRRNVGVALAVVGLLTCGPGAYRFASAGSDGPEASEKSTESDAEPVVIPPETAWNETPRQRTYSAGAHERVSVLGGDHSTLAASNNDGTNESQTLDAAPERGGDWEAAVSKLTEFVDSNEPSGTDDIERDMDRAVEKARRGSGERETAEPETSGTCRRRMDNSSAPDSDRLAASRQVGGAPP